jgi:ribonuclease HI
MSRKAHAPCPPVAKTLARVTLAEIEAAKSPKGGWTRAQLHAWGIAWPPTSGWKSLLTGIEHVEGAARPRAPMVTIITDASFCPRSNASGWAGWVKVDALPGAFFAGPIVPSAETPSLAEMAAVANTLVEAGTNALLRDGDIVMLQSDNQEVLSVLAFMIPGVKISRAADNSMPFNAAKRIARWWRDSDDMKRILAIVEAYKLQIVVRHIKGHTGGVDGRTNVNERCDSLAKHHMRQRRAAVEIRPVTDTSLPPA